MSRGLPIADAPFLERPMRRTIGLRNGLTAAIALLLAAAVVLAARGRDGGAAVASSRQATEIVLDVSGSVSDASYAVISPTLRRLARSSGPIGLILFSDVAEEALPPGSDASFLKPFAVAFEPAKQPFRGNPSVFRPTLYEPNPWYPSFSGGTRISTGLAAAREALRRDGVHGSLLLISDLGEAPDDRARLRRELTAVQQTHIPLRIMPLPNALKSDRYWFAQLEGKRPFVHPLPPLRPPRPASVSHGVPLALALAAALLALVLAADQLAGRSLRWGAAR